MYFKSEISDGKVLQLACPFPSCQRKVGTCVRGRGGGRGGGCQYKSV